MALDRSTGYHGVGSGLNAEKLGGLTLTEVLNQQNACFQAYKSGAAQTVVHGATDIVTFETEDFDPFNDFASNVYTPSVAGKYFFFTTLRFENFPATPPQYFTIYLYKNGSAYKEFVVLFLSNGVQQYNFCIMAEANGTTDYFDIRVNNSTGNSFDITKSVGLRNSNFGGYKISA